MIVYSDIDFSDVGYVAPTVFLKAGQTIPRWNYYNDFSQAVAAYSGNFPPYVAGSVNFLQDGTAQTFAINVDFYTLENGKWIYRDYTWIKKNGVPNGIIRMFTTQGAGTYYAVLSNRYFGASATRVDEYNSEKIAALDQFYRQVALLKYRYNSLVAFLNTLAARPLNANEQRIFNEGILKLQNLNNQLRTIEGIEVIYSESGKIGLPILLLIAIIAILAGATAWTVASIISEQEKTKRINDSFELSRWIADKKYQIAQQVNAGTLSQTQANSIYSTLDSAQAIGNKVATDSSKAGSMFGDIASLAKWGVLGLIAVGAYKLLNKPANVS